MVDLRPIKGAPGAPAHPRDIGRDLVLLAIQYDGTSTTDPKVDPVHYLDVQVAMFDGVNEHLRRQSNPHLKASSMRPGGDGNPLVAYSSDELIDVVTAAWQQTDPMDPATPAEDTTEQNIHNSEGRVIGSVYAIRADVTVPPGGSPRIERGSIRPVDPALIPANAFEAQQVACGRAARELVANGPAARLARAVGPEQDPGPAGPQPG